MVDSALKGSYLASIILGLIEKTTLTIMYCVCHTWNPIIHLSCYRVKKPLLLNFHTLKLVHFYFLVICSKSEPLLKCWTNLHSWLHWWKSGIIALKSEKIQWMEFGTHKMFFGPLPFAEKGSFIQFPCKFLNNSIDFKGRQYLVYIGSNWRYKLLMWKAKITVGSKRSKRNCTKNRYGITWHNGRNMRKYRKRLYI